MTVSTVASFIVVFLTRNKSMNIQLITSTTNLLMILLLLVTDVFFPKDSIIGNQIVVIVGAITLAIGASYLTMLIYTYFESKESKENKSLVEAKN